MKKNFASWRQNHVGRRKVTVHYARFMKARDLFTDDCLLSDFSFSKHFNNNSRANNGTSNDQCKQWKCGHYHRGAG
jgi:hypothetical protein